MQPQQQFAGAVARRKIVDYCFGIYFKSNRPIQENYIKAFNKNISLYNLGEKFTYAISGVTFKQIKSSTEIIIVDGNLDINDTKEIINNIDRFEIKYVPEFFNIIKYNLLNGTLLIVSDYFRSKPLYYAENDDYFIFSSNIEMILGYSKIFDIDIDWYSVIMKNNYSFQNNNVWKNIKENQSRQIIKVLNRITEETFYNSQPTKFDKFEDVLISCLESAKKNVSAISLSGGIDSMFLSKYFSVPSYSLSGGIFNCTGEKKIIEEFVKKNHIDHKFVEIPKINNRTIQLYKQYLYEYALPSFNLEVFYKSILCQHIKTDGYSNSFTTGQGSDELFGGYSISFGSYENYVRNLRKKFLVNSKTIREEEFVKTSFFLNDYLYQQIYSNYKNERELILSLEFNKLKYNALVSENFCGKTSSLFNNAPYVNLDIFKYMETIEGEKLYDKKLFRQFVRKYLGEEFYNIKKNPFIYNEKYIMSYRYIKKLITYKNEFNVSILDEILDSNVFNNIFDKKHFEEFCDAVLNEKLLNPSNLYLIEVILRIINSILLKEKWGF